MAKLTERARAELPASAFVYPRTRRYPIENRAHAISALGRVSRYGTEAEKRRVRKAVKRRYPDMHVRGLDSNPGTKRGAPGNRTTKLRGGKSGDPMKFLVNPPQGGETMAKRKVSEATRRKLRAAAKRRRRRADGSFAKGRANPGRKRASSTRKSSRTSSRKSSRRRTNPPARRGGGTFMDSLVDGAIGTVTITGSKVATRTVPKLLKLPTTGNTGLAVEIATAVALGWAADYMLGPSWGVWVLAGGLQAPVEDIAARFDIPWVSDALVPGTVGLYAPGPRRAMPAANATRRALPPGRVGNWITSPPGSGISPGASVVS